MVTLIPEITQQAFTNFQAGLKSLTYQSENKHTCRACLVCDRLLEWNDNGIICISRLNLLRGRFTGESPLFATINPVLKREYTYDGAGCKTWMHDMYLSPRGYYRADKDGFQCCKCCVAALSTRERQDRVKLPRFAIANGAVFGVPPTELTDLNDAELALASQARTNKHVFAFYGGAHKSMRGWHNLYENDVNGIVRTLNQVSNYGGNNVILCVLLGPFTPLQKQFVQNNMMVRPQKVIQALRWLKRNNPLYEHVSIPKQDEIAMPLIIDDTEHAESEDTNIESRMEYTVVFPETDTISTSNGGCMNQDEFLRQVVNAMDTTTETAILSRPTPHRVADYQGDGLLRAFPLQFPYGVGLPPDYPGRHDRISKPVAISKLSYLQHLQHLSIRNFHRGDFVLVLHNMYERQRAVSVSYLRAKNPMGNDSFAEHIAGMGLEELQNAINRTHAGLQVSNGVTREFLKSIDAVCKSMGHTNDTAKSARIKMLADTIRFGPGAVFLTITPDDSNCFRIKVYVDGKSDDPPDPMSATDEEVKADFDMSVQLRQDFPGLCAFDFQQITELMIEHVLGWDTTNMISYPEGGAFGILDAWNAAVEEQGRKTLHAHWILYVKDWSKLLHGLYSKDDGDRTLAAKELQTYVDCIMSTKLFGLDGIGNIVRQGYKHKCNGREPPIPIVCELQDMRNLRYKHGKSSLNDDKFLQCGECYTSFSSQDLVDNVLTNWFGNTTVLKQRVRLAVKCYSGQVIMKYTKNKRLMNEFMIQALTNLHASTHTATCFKKGSECRSKLPQHPCDGTRLHFYKDKPIRWWTWMGNFEEREPFVIETDRHRFDVFMNQYQMQLSLILGCNTNVQCGIDGGHIMYVTYYASKSTQTEDKYAYCRVAKTLYKRIRMQEENALNGIAIDNPFQEGYRRLLSAILCHTESTVISGPMAWFIMRNQGRFLFSHGQARVPIETLLGRSTPSRIINLRGRTFLENRVYDYIYRPEQLANLDWYTFVAHYDVVNISAKNENEIMRFRSTDHPLYSIRGIVARKSMVTPLISYLEFPNASEFEGNILDPDVVPNAIMEKFAKTVLCLFVPFHDERDFHQSSQYCYTSVLRHAIETNAISDESFVRLQNIQNCHNMMRAGRQEDILERNTQALPDAERPKILDHDAETQQDIENHIEMFLTELVADLDQEHKLRNTEIPYSLHNFRKQGKDNCGYVAICANSVDAASCIFELREDEQTCAPSNVLETTAQSQGWDQIMTKGRLTALSILAVRRHIEEIDSVMNIIPNGTAKSIEQWANIVFTNHDTNECDNTQQRAFEVIVSMFVLTFHHEAEQNEGKHDIGTHMPSRRATYIKLRKELNKMTGMKQQQQLILFLTGPGGSGKTKVINAVIAYAKGFCKELNYMFDKRLIVVTALSGVAATLINGETLHSAAKLNYQTITTDHIKEWKPTRLLIIDEISFANAADLTNLNAKLQLLKETIREKFGNLHIVFTGDFSQLKPVTGYPIYYETNFALWHDWINCYIELKGQHRFKNDPKFGAIMSRMRNGVPTEADISLLNTRVINGGHPNAPTVQDMPATLSYAVYRNVDKCAINNGIFAEHIRNTHSTDPLKPMPNHTLIIRSDDLTWKSNQNPFGPMAKHSVWSECSDCHIKTSGDHGKCVDPFLKLSTNIPLMYTENHDVPNGIANGTLCSLVKVVLQSHISESDFEATNIDGFYVRTIDASNVNYLLCKMEGSNRTFEVKSDYVSCKINMPIELYAGERTRKNVRATINRFPLLINHATTGHKLQGQTKTGICISDWHYGANWPYVVLSRVTTLKGLFLLKPLIQNHDFSHDKRLVQMYTRMRQKCPKQYNRD